MTKGEDIMKNKKTWRMILSVMLVAFFLCGCSDSKEEAPVEEVSEVSVEEEITEETEKEEEEDAQSVEEETPAEEEVAEESMNEETSTDMSEAQVTTTVADITEFAQYMANLDSKTPHVVIWNEAEGYLIDIKDGEYYHIKEGDRIFENDNNEIDAVWTTIPETKGIGMAEAYEIIPDYTKFNSPHECIYGIYLKEDPNTPIYITYYLDAPAE